MTIDLKLVLDICFEIHNDSGKRYRLLTRNCYFFAQTIIIIGVRRTVALAEDRLNDTLNTALKSSMTLEKFEGAAQDLPQLPSRLEHAIVVAQDLVEKAGARRQAIVLVRKLEGDIREQIGMQIGVLVRLLLERQLERPLEQLQQQLKGLKKRRRQERQQELGEIKREWQELRQLAQLERLGQQLEQEMDRQMNMLGCMLPCMWCLGRIPCLGSCLGWTLPCLGRMGPCFWQMGLRVQVGLQLARRMGVRLARRVRGQRVQGQEREQLLERAERVKQQQALEKELEGWEKGWRPE